jgi:predicted Zn-dependent protease
MTHERKLRHFAAPVSVAAVLAATFLACAINPVTHKTEFSLVSADQEIAMGRDADRQVIATMGLYDDPKIQDDVAVLGRKLAAKSERPNLPWTFRIVDDPVVNAFAVPGGFVYVTRGLMTHLNSEAELVAVLGHEIGHVTAKHGVTQMSRAQLAQLGLGVGSMLDPRVERAADALSQGIGLLFLKFSRDDERQADDLGLRYLVNAGYDPRPMADVFDALARVSAAEGTGRIPKWLSTHPDPGDRRAWATAKVASMGQNFDNAAIGRESYLALIDGMTFGDDPRNGYFKGDTFIQPTMKFRLDFPTGWTKANQTDSVFAASPGDDAAIRLSIAAGDSPDAAADAFFSQQQGITAGTSQRGNVQGLQVVTREFTAPSEQTPMSGVAHFVSLDERIYLILGFATDAGWGAQRQSIGRVLASFQRVTDPKLLAVTPWKIALVTTTQALTPEQFALKYPCPTSAGTLALVNRLDSSGRIPAGPGAKRIVGDKLP